MNNIIIGCTEVLKQAENFLQSSTEESYNKIIEPYFISSCGEHMRHILDHFVAIMNMHKLGEIDYDKRQRGSNIETDISKALSQIADINNWISTLKLSELEKKHIMKTEVSVSSKACSTVSTTLGRELIFASSHAIHHFSIISIIMKMQNFDMKDNFGIAPATASYLRSETLCAP